MEYITNLILTVPYRNCNLSSTLGTLRTIISSTREQFAGEDANTNRKSVTEKERLEVKEEAAIMQMTVVVAMCYFPAGHFYLFLTVCDVTCDPTTALHASGTSYLFSFFLFSYFLFSQQQPGAGMNYLTKGSSSTHQWKMQEHFFMDLICFTEKNPWK